MGFFFLQEAGSFSQVHVDELVVVSLYLFIDVFVKDDSFAVGGLGVEDVEIVVVCVLDIADEEEEVLTNICVLYYPFHHEFANAL